MKNPKLALNRWGFLLIILLVLGIFFRFVNLDKKVYWYDETITSLRLAGYTKEELMQRVAGQIIDVQILQNYQQLNSERDISDTLKSLALGNPEQPPIYYLTARFWVQLFGDSVGMTRCFSAVISLLTFPCIYWLSLELFGSPAIGWVAVSLVAISPLHVLYAQEARAYSLYTVMILLSSAVLLRALRSPTNSPVSLQLNWGLYAVTVAVGLYTQLLFSLVMMGHGSYILIQELIVNHKRNIFSSKKFLAYFLASALGFIAFIPWLFSMLNHFDGVGWVARGIAFSTLVNRWLINLSSLFLDIQIGYADNLFDVNTGHDPIHLGFNTFWLYLTLAIFLLAAYAVYFLIRQTPLKIWTFLLTLMGATALPLVLQDLVAGGQRSSIIRYLIPFYLAIQLTISYLITQQIFNSKSQHQKLWQLLTVCLLSSGIVSCTLSSQAETWWNKYSSYYNPQVAEIVNQTNQPLVISSNAVRLTSLSYELEDNVKLLAVPADSLPPLSESFTDLFLYYPSKKLKQSLEEAGFYQLNSVYPQGNLWRLSPPI